MNKAKCEALKADLTDQSEPQCIPIARFFEGNDDSGSIGCNLTEHPGIGEFRRIFDSIAARPDVEGVWAQISELDPGEDCWPFSDTVLVAGQISTEDLRQLVKPLQPDLVADARSEGFQVSPALEGKHQRLLVVWWD